MTGFAFTVFDTAIGPCGVAWTDRGVAGVQLPEGDSAATRRRLRGRFPGATEAPAPPEVQGACDGIAALLRGERPDLGTIRLDLRGVEELAQRVYAAARAVAPGTTTTYGAVASRLGDPLLAREVGRALARNPFALIVPCHRVLAAGGALGGFSAAGGTATKRRLLAIEGVHVGAPSLFDDAGGPGIR